MNTLSNLELKEINGGAINWLSVVGVVVGVGAFIIGVVDGFLRPYRCR